MQSPFGEALELIAPGASGAELVDLFQGKVASTTIINWRHGRFPPPAWAFERVHQLSRERANAVVDLLAKNRRGPGRKAGARNLAEYLARRR